MNFHKIVGTKYNKQFGVMVRWW